MAGVILEQIRKSFREPSGKIFEAVRDVSLEIQPGECFSLLGPSGCGKTTLLRIIAGLERPDSGRVLMGGRDVTALPPEKRPTAMVFQSYALFPHLTVEGNVSFGLKLRRKSKAEIRKKVDEVLELVQLAGLGGRKIDELSGGQQQRVALARVLAVEPEILLMDEPLSNLDASLRRSTRSAIRRIQTELGLTLIYVTHDQEEGLMISDRLALMMAGRVVQSGTPQELFDAPATIDAARFLGQRNVVSARVVRLGEDCVVLALAPENAASTLRILINRTGMRCAPSDKVWLAAMPDEFVLAAPAEKPASGWLGEIALVSFAGSTLELEIRLSETGEIVRVAQPLGAEERSSPPPLPQRGERVRVELRRGGGLIYPRES